jgi:hypothetical protein
MTVGVPIEDQCGEFEDHARYQQVCRPAFTCVMALSGMRPNRL